jgi:hypothetical protein
MKINHLATLPASRYVVTSFVGCQKRLDAVLTSTSTSRWTSVAKTFRNEFLVNVFWTLENLANAWLPTSDRKVVYNLSGQTVADLLQAWNQSYDLLIYSYNASAVCGSLERFSKRKKTFSFWLVWHVAGSQLPPDVKRARILTSIIK